MEEELFYNSVNDKIIGTFDISQDTVALKTLNDKIARDSGRVFAVQMNIGDGYTLAVKL